MSYALLGPLLRALDPETAHRLTIGALSLGLHRRPTRSYPALRRRLLGLDFPNPVGLAAGFDKNGKVPDATLRFGFGFVEVGTVTPRPQAGNPRPRVFRLPADKALINRLGFNNDGFEAVHARLAARRPTGTLGGIVGVNIGANRDSADWVADYAAGVARFADVADYVAINISSPNTPGLRDLQERAALSGLLERINAARAGAVSRVPLLLKIAPDLDVAALAAIAEAAVSAGIDGMIVANTTVARDGLADVGNAGQSGGLSGRPLFRRSTILLARLRKLVGDRMVLVGVGGIASADDAWAKLAAGADLVQLYTGLVYRGPGLASRILEGLSERLDRERITRIADVIGTETDRWAGLSTLSP